ncbi:Osmolarity sensor protein EnvZ [Lacunisphaera limnophila]|uniref:histidine kinase n=1 Tax=Lacunisphaera limnophila TaxID=1838286 RepID=A0A1D8AS48_9BACT|nr:ATP-binding protein [Lacunisphaera limnophila]AOS43718.1 Osmolarity sensor protein EnvZ [Lacunisphaera limnophila]
MKFFPKTLLGRTALYLGALFFLVQALWFATARYLLETQIKPAYGQQIIDMVAMAQALVEGQPPGTDLTSIETLRLPSLGALEIVSDSQPRPDLIPHDGHDIPGDLSASLQQRFGPSALFLREKDVEITWLRFPARGQYFWLKFLTEPDQNAITSAKFLLISVQLALAVGGAYLIVFRLTKKLRYVTEAAKEIGRGKPPGILEVSGPEEIRALSDGFNQMSRDLIKLEADRRLMLAGISHDLRTPLTRLRIAAELNHSNDGPAMVHDIEDMDAILRQFLDYARDGSEEPPAEHDLNALIRETVGRYAARDQMVKTDLGAVPPFPFRRNSMRRVLDNLIDNAVRYGKKGVRVTTTCNAEIISITVTDSGPGIRSGHPADYIKPFAREDVSRSERGAGLGLAIVDRVVRLHHGSLCLENTSEGGLRATIELPYRP